VLDAARIERAVTAFTREPNGGLIVTISGGTIAHRDLITTLAAQHRLPTVYPARYFVSGGGLFSYGPNTIDPYRRAAGYVDRIGGLAHVLQRGAPARCDRSESADYVAESRWRSQPAVMKEPENSSLRRSKEWSQRKAGTGSRATRGSRLKL